MKYSPYRKMILTRLQKEVMFPRMKKRLLLQLLLMKKLKYLRRRSRPMKMTTLTLV